MFTFSGQTGCTEYGTREKSRNLVTTLLSGSEFEANPGADNGKSG